MSKPIVTHGWVTPLAGGLKARCGGPGVCPTCNEELNALAIAREPLQRSSKHPMDERIEKPVTMADLDDLRKAGGAPIGTFEITDKDRRKWRAHTGRRDTLEERNLEQWRQLSFLALGLEGMHIIPAWQPLTDGNHALEVAAALYMHMGFEEGVACAWIPLQSANYQTVSTAVPIDMGAMRTAIVMCAAYHVMTVESRKVIT